MRQVILDTDIVSEILKDRDPHVRRRKDEYLTEFGVLSTTSLTVLEVLSGLHKRNANSLLAHASLFFQIHSEITPSQQDYRFAARIIGDLQKSGTPIGIVDPLIAACAFNRGCSVATGNVRHYEFIRRLGYGLVIENWREA